MPVRSRRRVVTRRIAVPGLLAAAALAAAAPGATAAPAAPAAVHQEAAYPQGSAYAATIDYVVRFWPRWTSWKQASRAPANTLVGPERMNPVFGEVVAPNDDTLYVSSFTDLSAGPLVLTVPDTRVTYSILTMDMFGTVFDTGIEPGVPGSYLLTPPGWSGTVPAGLTRLEVPVAFSNWILRADKYSPEGRDQVAQAELFRSSLRLASLADWQADPSAGRTHIVPTLGYSTRFRVEQDLAATQGAVAFLKEMRQAVRDESTPMTPSDMRVAAAFDRVFGAGDFPEQTGRAIVRRSQIVAGAHAAYDAIVDNYHSKAGPTNWVNFDNIGAWGRRYLDRASTTEYLQWSNTSATAAYFHAFKDESGAPLDPSAKRGYVLTFAKDELPQAKRFWSVTAYTPGSITLIPGKSKYLVASYTPNLQTASDGSVSIYMFPTRPKGVPPANWLPVPKGPFNVVLRVYGPEGTVASGTYTPPAIESLGEAVFARATDRSSAGPARPSR